MSMSAPDLRGERGFTLVELLVASLAGIIVAAALGAIVITSVHFSASFRDRVDATQQGRVAMEKITQALNSSCVAAGLPPIVGVTSAGNNSDATHLVFYSALSDAPTINPNLVTVSLTGGQLVMSTAAWVSGSAPTVSNPAGWTFSTTPTNFVLVPYAAQTGSTPVFQYFGYLSGAISTTPYSVPLSAANALTTAMITISFKAFPSNNHTNQVAVGADVNDSVVLRLTPASSSGNASNTPCT